MTGSGWTSTWFAVRYCARKWNRSELFTVETVELARRGELAQGSAWIVFRF